MPGVASLNAHQYYAHPRNAFWPIINNVYGAEANEYDSRVDVLNKNRVALWDVLKACHRPGSLDSNIKPDSVVCNNFNQFFRQYQKIERVLFNGKAAEKIFRKSVLPELDDAKRFSFHALPSTSPAMASLSLAEKTRLWRDVLIC